MAQNEVESNEECVPNKCVWFDLTRDQNVPSAATWSAHFISKILPMTVDGLHSES